MPERTKNSAASRTLRNRALYQRYANISDAELNLFEAAIAVAQEEFPEVSVSACREQVVEISAIAHAQMKGGIADRYAQLSNVMFETLGFRGNQDDYYNPLNSYIPEVLTRRSGIPISLAIVFVEVARELGLSAVGVSFPGHFLVRHLGAEDLVLDPFNGKILTQEQLLRRLGDEAVDQAQLSRLLSRTSVRPALIRLVSNLKHAYMLKADHERSLRCCEIILILDPSHATSYRDRGLIQEKLELFRNAEADLSKYLELAPTDRFAPAITDHLSALRERVSLFH